MSTKKQTIHYGVPLAEMPLCGVMNAYTTYLWSYKPNEVTCPNCRRTKSFKKATAS